MYYNQTDDLNIMALILVTYKHSGSPDLEPIQPIHVTILKKSVCVSQISCHLHRVYIPFFDTKGKIQQDFTLAAPLILD